MIEFICMNTMCGKDDAETCCGCCGMKIDHLGDGFMGQPDRARHCTRCGHALQAFDAEQMQSDADTERTIQNVFMPKEIIDRAAAKASEVPTGKLYDPTAFVFKEGEN